MSVTPKQALEGAASAVRVATSYVPISHRWIVEMAVPVLSGAAQLSESNGWDASTREIVRQGIHHMLWHAPGVESADAKHIARGVVAIITVIRRNAGLEVE